MKILLNNNKVLNTRLLFYIMTLSLLVGCEITRKPNFIKNGREYRIIGKCVDSHVENKFGYHYGYNFVNGKHEWHIGYYDVNVCDKTFTDTIEINLKKKYYR